MHLCMHTPGDNMTKLIPFLLLLPLVACDEADDSTLQTVESVDVEQYMGTWYEIANFPMRFQEGCTGTTATYSLDGDKVKVLNRCFIDTLDGEEEVAEGWARVVDTESNAKLEVSFFRPFWGDYWVIDLADDYSYAVVGHPDRSYLWILSRTPQMDEQVYAGILERLVDESGYDLTPLTVTDQPEQ